MSAALANSAVSCKALRTSAINQRQSAPFVHVRPSLFRITHSKQHLTTPCGLGGGPDDRKVLRREEEPEEYWSSEAERKGVSPFKDPLAIIGIVSILLPFIILGIAIGTGVVDVSAGR